MKLARLKEETKEAVAVFISALKLGYDPRTEISAGRVGGRFAIFIMRRGKTFSIQIDNVSGITFDYWQAEWKNAARQIAEGVTTELENETLYEKSVFRQHGGVDMLVKGLLNAGMFTAEDAKEMPCSQERKTP